MDTTNVFSKLLAAYTDPEVRVIVLRGGTRSSKTWSALQLLNLIAAKSKRKRLVSIVSETMPHLKKGAIRDFENMLDGEGMYDRTAWHDTDKIYSYEKGRIEFFSADQPGKVAGPARQVLYINECINVSWAVYQALAVRTTEKIILDYNPEFDFWVDEKILVRSKGVALIDSTYLDNDMLTQAQIDEIESNREVDPDWFNVYGLGQKGSKEGLVIKNWDIVEALPPPELRSGEWIGIDFGWTAPSAVMHIVLSQGEVYIDELAYGANMDNPQIAKIIVDAGLAHLEVIADSAEPKSVAEVKSGGVPRIEGAQNKDILLGLVIMNRYKKHYTARSLGSIEENRKYRYPKDSDGNYGALPIKKFGHAKDAERYVFLNRLSNILPPSFSVTVGRKGRKK